MNEQSSNANLFHILSWVCLLVGWITDLGIIAFVLGIFLAGKAIREGADAGMARKANIISLVIVGVLFVLALLGFAMFFFV